MCYISVNPSGLYLWRWRHGSSG